MYIPKLPFALALLLAASSVAAKQEKRVICHVGNEAGPAGEIYDPDCVPGENNGYFCPDAGKIDLIVVAKWWKHLDNAAHEWNERSDYDPLVEGASGVGTEDSDGNGIDDGCEVPTAAPCPCWSAGELGNVTAANIDEYESCSAASYYPDSAAINNTVEGGEVEGGFRAFDYGPGERACTTRDFGNDNYGLTAEEAAACMDQIAARCADLEDPIVFD